MEFISAVFLIFFPLVCIFYFLLPQRFRWILLLASSCLFYAWFIPQYLCIIWILILSDFWISNRIESRSGTLRKIWLAMGIIIHILTLISFRYSAFFLNGTF